MESLTMRKPAAFSRLASSGRGCLKSKSFPVPRATADRCRIYHRPNIRMVQRVLRNTKPRPRFIEPMECRRASKLPEGGDWVYEIKQDGYRATVLVDGNSALIYSISGQ